MSFRHAGLTCFLAFFSSQLNDRSLSFSVMVRITRQGFPPAMTLDGISFVTTLPAAMILLSPMVTPGVMVTPPQIHTLFPAMRIRAIRFVARHRRGDLPYRSSRWGR